MVIGYSLHIGVNRVDPEHYAGWDGKLNACEYDAKDMKSLAANSGYQTKTLMTEAATRENVTSTIKAIAKKAKAGDIFFLSFSGHGGQVSDVNGDEVDGKDETWCLFDSQLLDDELYRLYASFPSGVRIIILSDSCHSGTVTRAAFTRDVTSGVQAAVMLTSEAFNSFQLSRSRYRFMPAGKSVETYSKNEKFYTAVQKKGKLPGMKASVQLISGCQDNQFSLDGDYNGLFTGTLLQIWGNGSFDGNYRSFHRAISKRMPPTQSPKHYSYGPDYDDFEKEYPFEI
jgi:hypothetical protein